MARFPLTWRLSAIASIFSAISAGIEMLRRIISSEVRLVAKHHQNTPIRTSYWMLMFTTSNVKRSGGSALMGFGVNPAQV